MTDHEFNLRYAEWLGKEWEPGDKDFERRTARHFYDLGHQEACRAQYHDFQQGEKHAAQNIIEMIHNGWHMNAIEALCCQKIEEVEKEKEI